MTSLVTSLAKQFIVQVVVDNMTSNAPVKIQQTKEELQRCSSTSVVIPHTLLASMAKQCPNAIQTMTNQHPIVPTSELIKKWLNDCVDEKFEDTFICIAQWGADQELEACVDWLAEDYLAADLRAARRPKPPSLAEEALAELNLTSDNNGAEISFTQVELIRRALERLQKLEEQQ